jgi:predicted DCC family thiol-disulfide oxidoreductase YuxK
MNNQKPDIWFVFDGECPICRMGASLFKVRQNVGTLHTVDARREQDHPVMKEVNSAKLNLDAGMILKYEGKLYQGDEALVLMANIGDAQDTFNLINRVLFRSKVISKLCYPFMKLARDIAITFKGVGKINNLEQ